MWFDSKCQIVTFSGNLSMPQIEQLKNSLHTCWLSYYSEGREDDRDTCIFFFFFFQFASLNAVLLRKDNRLLSVLRHFKVCNSERRKQ